MGLRNVGAGLRKSPQRNAKIAKKAEAKIAKAELNSKARLEATIAFLQI
jgi:hypothetical protein